MSGIYIHIPFCKQKCFYCNFYSISDLKNKHAVIEAIIEELKQRKDYLQQETVETIYFGGGTPTLLDFQNLEKILQTIYQNFSVAENPEITIEANPENLTSNFSKELKQLFNRISIGIQSFNKEELEYIGRLHHIENSKKAIENVRSAGFKNISLDLIYGIQNNLSLFQKSLETLISYQPEHISAYTLTCEPNTIFENLVLKNKRTLASEESIVEQYLYLIEYLKKNNYLHYEISNFSLPDKHSKHNSNYWNEIPYLGVGPSAHSFNKDSRQWNPTSIENYLKAIKENTFEENREFLTRKIQMEEFIMLRLRTTQGLPIQVMSNKFGKEIAEQFHQKAQKYLNTKELYIEDDFYRISEKSLLVSDSIIANLF